MLSAHSFTWEANSRVKNGLDEHLNCLKIYMYTGGGGGGVTGGVDVRKLEDRLHSPELEF